MPLLQANRADVEGLTLKKVWRDLDAGETSVPVHFGVNYTENDAATFGALCILAGLTVAINGKTVTVTP